MHTNCIMSNFDLGKRRTDLQEYYRQINQLRRRQNINIPEVTEGDLEEIELNPVEGIDDLLLPSETTPLLSSSAAAGTSTGGILSSIPATGAASVAGLGGAAIIGSVFSAITNSDKKSDHRKPFISLPDHKYLGPGNTLNTGEKPLDKDDLQAFNHDHDYNKAKTPAEVREADREHILNSLDDIIKGDIHSIISGAGIGAKYGIESITGVKYPLTGWYFSLWVNQSGSLKKRGIQIKELIGLI